MTCITNDNATSNGNKCNEVIKKKKMLEEGAGKRKEINNEVNVTIEEKKETKDEKKTKITTKMKGKKLI
jgi:hypothetical protein